MFFRVLRFRSVLTLTVLSLLLVALLSVGALSFYYGLVAVNELANTIVRQTVLRIGGELRHYAEAARRQNAESSRLIQEEKALTASNLDRVATATAPSFAVRTELKRTYFGLEHTGEYFSLSRGDNGEIFLREIVLGDDGQKIIRHYQYNRGNWDLIRTVPWDNYDPRLRPFYRDARQAGTNIWTGTYSFWTSEQQSATTGLTYATPVLDSRGNLLGVWATDFETKALCEFLASLRYEVPGYAFVVEEKPDGSRHVVAHPQEDMLRDQATGQLVENLDSLRDAAAQTLLQSLPGRFADLAIRPHRNIEFSSGGTTYLGGFELSRPDNRWMVCMVLPKGQLMETVYHEALAYGLLFAAILFVALLLVLIVARRTSRPLLALHSEAEAVGRLDLNPGEVPSTHILEISELADAMDRMKANLRSFRKYVPADLVTELIRSGVEATLGGEPRIVSVYFSDIANFTTISEQLEPSALVAQLGEYLGVVSDVIARQRGTVDKFIGDAVMAFWNAPRPHPTHALAACEAALANQRALVRLQQTWQREGKPLFNTRIGLHTGQVIAGNIGSEQRINYTIIGDPVNVASRLEGLNKYYGTRILISEAICLSAGNAILARPLDKATVKGRQEGIVIYELVALREEANEREQQLVALTQDAFEAYIVGDFAAAEERYARVLVAFPDDLTARLLQDRCAIYRANSPGPIPPSVDTTILRP